MRVLYDLSVLGAAKRSERARTGVYRVVENVARYLARREDIELFWGGFGNPDHLPDVIDLLREDISLCRPVVASTTLRRVLDWVARPIDYLSSTHFYPLVRHSLPTIKRLREKTALNRKSLTGFDVIHSPFYPLPVFERPQSGLARVLTVYDLIPIKFPDYFEAGICERTVHTLKTLTPDDWLLCISESTRRDMLEYRPDLDPTRVRVTPLAAADHFYPCDDVERKRAVRERLGIPPHARYFLSVCTLEPRKNLQRLIEAFRQLGSQLDEDVYLILVGATGWHIQSLIDDVAGREKERILITGYVHDEDLSPLYSDAVAFVYPSLYEGFGLPPLEAMQCGTPVITSNNSSLPEVVGDAGLLVSATSIDELANAMLQVESNAHLRQSLTRAGLERARRFSWVSCGDLTVDAYRDAIASSR